MAVKKKKEVKRQSHKDEERSKIGVSIDTQLWRRLRALAIREGKNTGELLDAAIEDYLERQKE